MRVTSDEWGPLQGQLLNLSYGTGRIHLVLEDRIGEVIQGGVVQLPLFDMPTGIMRGRFHPDDGQLYVCGLFGWSSDKTEPGGFYRIRYTGKPLNMPVQLQAKAAGVILQFSDPLDPDTAANARHYAATRCNYRATPKYGSDDYRVSNPRRRGRDRLRVEQAVLSTDGKTLTLGIRDMRPAMQMEIKYRINAADGLQLSHTVHFTIHTLGSDPNVAAAP